MNKLLQNYLQTLTLVIHVDSRKTQNYKWWEIYISMYPLKALTWPISWNKEWCISANLEKTILLVGAWETNHRNYGSGEWRFFWWRSLQMFVPLRIFRIYFLRTMYLFLFFKKWLTNLIRLSTKRYILETQKMSCKKSCATCATFPFRNFLFQWVRNIFNVKH